MTILNIFAISLSIGALFVSVWVYGYSQKTLKLIRRVRLMNEQLLQQNAQWHALADEWRRRYEQVISG